MMNSISTSRIINGVSQSHTFLIVAVLLFVGVFLGVNSSIYPLSIVGSFFLLVAFLISLKNLRTGLLLFLIVALFSNIISQVLPTGFLGGAELGMGAVLRDILLLSVLIGWFFTISTKDKARVYIPLKYPLIYICIIALFIVISPEKVTAILGFRNTAFYIVILYLTVNVFSSKQQIKRAITVIIAFGGLLAVFGLLQPLTGGVLLTRLGFEHGVGGALVRFGKITRSSAGVDNPLVFGIYMVMLILIAASLWLSTKKKSILLLVIIFLMITALIFTFSRSAVFALIASLLFISVFLKRFKLMVGLILILSGLLLFSVIFYDSILVQRFFSQDEVSRIGIATRIAQVERSFQYINDNPLLGIGLGTQGAAKARFAEGLVPGIITDNYYFQILTEMGLVGLLAYLLLLVSLFIKGVSIYYSLTDTYLKSLALGIVGIIVAMSIMNLGSSTFDSRILNMYFWFFMGILLSLRRANKCES
ncbi:MAG TPA: hypothetical protein DCK79_11945 [Candidatus Atribacteria bacterium]|jgi:O-antigen ligase|nr:hypothetical protein [Candidatus Atribacteria bacterium]